MPKPTSREGTPFDPIRHLIDAVTEAQTPETNVAALHQDCAEHADELEDFLRHIRCLLNGAGESDSH
jgi:hypothetical protein